MLIEKIKFIHKAPKSKVGDSTKSIKIFLAKVTLKLVKRNICCWFYVRKIILGHIKSKI